MKHVIAILMLAVASASAQTNTGVVIGSDGVLRPSNAVAVIRSGIFGTNVAAPLVVTNGEVRVKVGTTAGTVAAGDDARIVNAVQQGDQVPDAAHADKAWFLEDTTQGTHRLWNDDGDWFGDLAGLAEALDVATVKYASFDIELGGQFTDFELKGTVTGWATMVFFYHSPDPSKSVITGQVWTTRPDVFFTDSQYVGTPSYRNQRYWRKQNSSQSIAAMRSNGNSVIAGVTVVVRDRGVISSRSPTLVWSYCRMTPTGYEQDAGGKSIWRPITPKWITQTISP